MSYVSMLCFISCISAYLTKIPKHNTIQCAYGIRGQYVVYNGVKSERNIVTCTVFLKDLFLDPSSFLHI